MTIQLKQCLTIACLAVLSAAAPAQTPASQDKPESFNDWLNQQIVAKVNQRSNTKQVEMPSLSGASTSLVDQSSATDLISAAFNLTGVSNNSSDSAGPKSGTVTASAYSLFALFKRTDPLDARFYNDHRNWRRAWFTLGNDNGSTNGGTTTPRATIAGIKVLIINKRDVSMNKNDPGLGQITSRLQSASVAFGRVWDDITLYLIRNPRVRSAVLDPGWSPFLDRELQTAQADNDQDRADRIQAMIRSLHEDRGQVMDRLFMTEKSQWTREEKKYFAEEFQAPHLNDFDGLVKLAGGDSVKNIAEIIDRRIGLFSNLDSDIRETIEKIRRKPQFSVAFTSTTRPGAGANEYVAETIFDYGVANRINVTLNNTFNYKDTKVLGGISRGSKFTGDLQFQMTQEKSLSGRGPVTFDLATEGDWMTKAYKGQVKIKIPIASGIDLPISVTFANRSDLINEQDVVGKFGFTFDTAKLISIFSH